MILQSKGTDPRCALVHPEKVVKILFIQVYLYFVAIIFDFTVRVHIPFRIYKIMLFPLNEYSRVTRRAKLLLVLRTSTVQMVLVCTEIPNRILSCKQTSVS